MNENTCSISLFGWVGGKTKLASQIISRFPPHDRYIELFMGSGAIFFEKNKAQINVLNDINELLVNLFVCCRDNLKELIQRTRFFHKNRDMFNLFKNIITSKSIKSYDRFDIAAMYLYLIRNSFNNEESFNFRTYPNSSNEDWSHSINNLLTCVSNKLKDVIVENLHYSDFIKKYLSPLIFEGITLIYVDPPYWIANTTKYYRYNFTKYDHEVFSEIMHRLNTSKQTNHIVISYDDVPRIRELYKDWYITPLTDVYYSMYPNGNAKKNELLITNFKPNEQGELEWLQKKI